ncbi:hypothetical protein SAMN05216299_1218 [Nitrosospira sp. Nsp14]|nr:hypothetical protein SAMN05216299_1218 [Nitrosospira sp. Nsp14]
MATILYGYNGKPGTAARFCLLYDRRANPPWFRRHIAWLRKKLFGALAIKRFDARMINPNGRILVTVGIKPFY